MDPRHLLTLAPAFLRPALGALLDRLDRLEREVAELRQAQQLQGSTPPKAPVFPPM